MFHLSLFWGLTHLRKRGFPKGSTSTHCTSASAVTSAAGSTIGSNHGLSDACMVVVLSKFYLRGCCLASLGSYEIVEDDEWAHKRELRLSELPRSCAAQLPHPIRVFE